MDATSIYRPYTPSRQDPALLARTFTGRDSLFDELLTAIRDQAGKPTHQHWLFVGPRGIGKSHLIAMLRHRATTDADLAGSWLTLPMPEEAAGVVSLRDLVGKILGHMAVALKSGQDADQAARAEAFLQQVTTLRDDRQAIDRIKAFLLEWREKAGRKLLLLVENADRVIGARAAGRLDDEKWLRDFLMNHDALMVVATSPSYFKQVLNRDSPLHEMFRTETLEELDFAQSQEFLIKYATADGRPDLAQRFDKQKSRLEALYTLTGGNPRLLLMLYVLVQASTANIDDVEKGFFNLLEELTPYFQARLNQLGPKEEKILVAFAEGAELLTPAEVGRKLRLTTNKVTALLTGLQAAGFVRRLEQPVKGRKGTLYRLSETIYRYWYQIHSERHRDLAEIFIRFIVLFFTYREITELHATFRGRAGAETCDPGTSPRCLAYLEAARREARQMEIGQLRSILKTFPAQMPSHEQALECFARLKDLDGPEPDLLVLCGAVLLLQDDPEKAVDEAIALCPENYIYWE